MRVIAFAPLFSKPVFKHVQVLLVGAMPVAGFADCHQCFASDGLESGKAFSNLSSGSQSGAMEFFVGFSDFVKVVDQGI